MVLLQTSIHGQRTHKVRYRPTDKIRSFVNEQKVSPCNRPQMPKGGAEV